MQVLNIFHVLVAIAMVAFVLVQRGPGATAGAAFGSGASGTVFGSRGAGSFLSRATWVLATLFCVISLTMAIVVSRSVVAPETDLGVIGAQGTTEQVDVAPVGDGDLPQLNDADQGTDLPELDTSAAEEAPGDLPEIDEESSTEPQEEPSGTDG